MRRLARGRSSRPGWGGAEGAGANSDSAWKHTLLVVLNRWKPGGVAPTSSVCVLRGWQKRACGFASLSNLTGRRLDTRGVWAERGRVSDAGREGEEKGGRTEREGPGGLGAAAATVCGLLAEGVRVVRHHRLLLVRVLEIACHPP